ncbi:MAG: Asp-tRNA(Asn)/Glu-tRNA(Gln) amidotransferase subunit GatC [Bacteroidota bacterium]
MKVDDQLISRLEHLSRLQLSVDERKMIQNDLENILTMVEKLQEVDVEDIEPLVYVNASENRLREDEIKHQATREEALRNAPSEDGTFFSVPKVIER